MLRNYHLSLLYLTHLLVSVDGDITPNEIQALNKIRESEKIPDDIFKEFKQTVPDLKEKELYDIGIKLINQCTNEEKLKAFVMLYKMSEVDGRVHVKEVRLLLYSIKSAGLEFDDVVSAARAASPII